MHHTLLTNSLDSSKWTVLTVAIEDERGPFGLVWSLRLHYTLLTNSLDRLMRNRKRRSMWLPLRALPPEIEDMLWLDFVKLHYTLLTNSLDRAPGSPSETPFTRGKHPTRHVNHTQDI